MSVKRVQMIIIVITTVHVCQKHHLLGAHRLSSLTDATVVKTTIICTTIYANSVTLSVGHVRQRQCVLGARTIKCLLRTAV